MKAKGLVFILNKPLKQSTLKLYRLEPSGVVREVLSTDYSVDGVLTVLEYVATVA
jgi:hypothetical protein